MKTYGCCFELPHKKIALNVSEGSKNIAFTTSNGGNTNGSVCLRKDELEDLVTFIQGAIKKF